MSGPPPTPTRLRVLRGNPGKRPLPQNEPEPSVSDGKPPMWLRGRGRRIWNQLVPELLAIRLLTAVDIEALAVLCETQAEFIEARADVRKRGVEIEVTRYSNKGERFTVAEQNPNVKIAADAGRRVRAMMAEFGLTPASRTRVKTTKPKDEQEDKWAGLLS